VGWLIISEDLWNDQMGDSVAVPVYRYADAKPSRFRVDLGDGYWAECTKTLSVDHRLIGVAASRCPDEAWVNARIGVRRFLDIDRRIATATTREAGPRADWWPRQHDVHFVENPRISSDDKLYAVISDNAWNSADGAPHAACVRLTSHTKPARERWEVPVAGSWIVSGDLYLFRYDRFQQQPPRADYPKRISPDESSALASKQKFTLSLQ
jgi:hypothetical protein